MAAYRLRVRKFLNRLGYHAGAYVLAEVEDSTGHRKGKHGWPYVDINLTLADCGRAVSLEFDIETPGARANSLRKINLLIDTLIQFGEALEAEAQLAATRDRGRKKSVGDEYPFP